MEQAIPEKELKQHRDILKQFGVAGRKPGQEPVLRQARNPDENPQDNSEYYPRKGDLHCVQKADKQRPGIGVRGRVGYQRLADFKAGLL